MKYYAGIGSRETPPDIKNIMGLFATKMENKGWILRSGGAPGADSAFEHGIKDPHNMEIFLPTFTFNGKYSSNIGYYNFYECSGVYSAIDTVHKFHPTPYKLSTYAKFLMARNAMQVLGRDLKTPSKMIVCWTPDAKIIGGTAQAIRIATHYNIPVYNLADPSCFNWIVSSLTKCDTL